MRGIDGVNDGQQIYSYDEDFQDSKSEGVRSLFTYQTPALGAGVVMSEEIALTMPKAFIFRKLNNGTCAVTLNTYLGRDYMGSTGRFGNYLSHSIICNEEEYAYYPCEFYGNEMLRDCMEYGEVNNPERPPFLPTPELLRGYLVNINNVIEFLGEDDRMGIFKNMLHAMLSFENERKRLVICDEPKNIVLWIAALEYTLPLKLALNINFTTYEYDPSLSRSQICGVVPNGTKYTPEIDESLRQYFIFDLYTKDTVDFNEKGEFYDFIEAAMLFSYDILKSFHEFLTNSYSYSNANLDYYSAYSLYKLRSYGILNINKEIFVNAISFAERFASDEEKVALTEQLLSEKDIIFQFDDIYSLEVFRYILGSYSFLSVLIQEQIKGFVLEKILNSFRETGKSKEEFIHFYNNMDKLCNTAGFNIVAELMNECNQQKIFAAVQYDVSNWKLDFIIKVLCKYVEDKSIPIEELRVEYPIGKLYAGIVQSMYKENENDGYFVVTQIFDNFSNNHKYLTNMALNIEEVLLSLPSGEAASHSMWKLFYEVILKSQCENRNSVFTILNNSNRMKQMYGLFELLLNSNQDSIDKNMLFKEHYEFFVLNNIKYSREYLPCILEAYYEYVKRNRDRNWDITLIEIELFEIIYQNKLDVLFVYELIDDIIKKIPLGRPSKENANIIIDIFDYNFEYRRQNISGKVLLIFVGMSIEGIKSNKDLQSVIVYLKRIVSDKGINLSEPMEKDVDSYLEWIMPHITSYCRTSKELKNVYKLFNMPPRISKIYITMCANDYLKQSKNDKNYDTFCEFLKFLFDVGTSNEREATGKVLCKLSKQKLEFLDNEVKTFFYKDRHSLQYWDEIKEIALSTNPLLNSISNFLKRIKK